MYKLIKLIDKKKILLEILLILATIDTFLTLYIIKAGIGYEINIIPAFFLNNPNLPTIIIYPSLLVVKFITLIVLYYYTKRIEEQINKFIIYLFYVFLIIVHVIVIYHSLSIIFLKEVIINI
jgi:hypothetical protein